MENTRCKKIRRLKIMIDLKACMNYEQYISKGTEEQTAVQEKQYEATTLSKGAVDKLRDLKEGANVIIFSEGYCPDCIVTIPFVMRMSEVNENIKVYFMPRKGNERLLEEYAGESRIPTVMVFTPDMQPKGLYVEFPEALKEKMTGLTMEEVKNTVKQYRNGQYDHLIEEEILNILTK
jgi:hypothetical protein